MDIEKLAEKIVKIYDSGLVSEKHPLMPLDVSTREYYTLAEDVDDPLKAYGIIVLYAMKKYEDEISNYFDSLDKNFDLDINKEELSLCLAWDLCLAIKEVDDRRNAQNRAYAYQSSRDIVDYYRSEGRAFDKGYEDYMKYHTESDIEALFQMLEIYKQSQKDKKTIR